MFADYSNPVEGVHDIGVLKAALIQLAKADAFGSLGLKRREALWQVAALDDRPIGLFKGHPSESTFEQPATLPTISDSENVVHDYAATTFSLNGHPLQYIRPHLKALGCTSSEELKSKQNGDFVRFAGLPFVRQRPGTAKGVCFITLEDEVGNTNLIAWKNVYNEFRKPVNNAKLLCVEGHLQIQHNVTHIIIERCFDLTQLFSNLTASKNTDVPLIHPSTADLKTDPAPNAVKKAAKLHQMIQGDLFAASRNFR